MILAALLLVAAALAASGILFSHQRWLTYLAAAGAFFEGAWLLLTLIDRTALVTVSSTVTFTGGAVLLALIWLPLIRSWRRPQFLWQRELAVALTTGIVLIAGYLIVSVNGFHDGSWVTHGFYNGDTMTFISLVQRSQLTESLAQSNPFAAGGPLEYPTLSHAAWATFFSAVGLPFAWLALLPTLTLFQIVVTVPLFFLLWDLVTPEPKGAWQLWLGIRSRSVLYALQAVIALYVMALAWDGYIYPQSHFFLTVLFLLQTALLIRAWSASGREELLYFIPAANLALLLLLSNAVTGTAAVAIVGVFCALRAATRSRPVRDRATWLFFGLVLFGLFVFIPPGDSSFGVPGFSYTAVSSLTLLAPVMIALVAAMWLADERHFLVSALVASLIAMTFVPFFFSTRSIVVENAGRFIYHAALVGFPLLLAPLIRIFYFLRRELQFEGTTLPRQLIDWTSVAALILIVGLPGLASIASAHDHLMYQDRYEVSPALQEALSWIRDNTSPNAVIAASPAPPWTVPQFTGRSLVRIDHWLSPQDEIFTLALRAWSGDTEAQALVLQEAQFLLLTHDERERWSTLEYEEVFSNGEVTVFRL